MKTVMMFKDIPDALIELMNEIKYNNLTPAQGKQKLAQLEQYIQTDAKVKSFVKIRQAGSYGQKQVHFNDNVPDEAIKLLLKYNFSAIPSIVMPLVKSKVREELKKLNLL